MRKQTAAERPDSLNVVMPKDLTTRLKFQAVKEGKSLSAVIRSLVQQYLDKAERKEGKK